MDGNITRFRICDVCAHACIILLAFFGVGVRRGHDTCDGALAAQLLKVLALQACQRHDHAVTLELLEDEALCCHIVTGIPGQSRKVVAMRALCEVEAMNGNRRLFPQMNERHNARAEIL